MKIKNTIIALLICFTGYSQTVIMQTSDNMGNEFTQAETTTATPFAIRNVTPDEKEAGRLTINYNAVNPSTGAAADRALMVRYKKVNGVVTIIGSQTIYTNNDTGLNTVAVSVTASGGSYSINVTGVAGMTLRHTLITTTLSSNLRE